MWRRDAKKTILFVHNSLMISGAEVSLELILKNFIHRYNIVVILPIGTGNFLSKLHSQNIEIKQIPLVRLKRTLNPITLLYYVFNIILCNILITYYIFAYRVNLLHSNNTICFLYSAIPGAVTRAPNIWHVRDRIPSFLPVRFLKHFCAYIISISKYTMPGKLGIDKKDIVLYNAIDINAYEKVQQTNSLRDRFKIPADGIIIAQIGQLIPWKNHIDLILVAEKIVKDFQSVRFLIIGDDLFKEYGSYIASLKEMISSKQLEEYVFFVNYQPDILSIISEIDILFHPAATEPFGRVIIEAMALKKPVIAVNAGGPSEIISDKVSGYLVSEHSMDEMAVNMLHLLRNSNLRARMGEEGQKVVLKSFSIETHLEKLDSIYRNLI